MRLIFKASSPCVVDKLRHTSINPGCYINQGKIHDDPKMPSDSENTENTDCSENKTVEFSSVNKLSGKEQEKIQQK